MSIRTIATLAVAIFLGLIAVVLVRDALSTQRANGSAATTTGTVPVVVAAEPFARGEALEAVKLKIVNFPAGAVPSGTFHNVAALGGQRLALGAIVANEPVLAQKISAPGGKLNMSAEIGSGLRAVSIRANDVSGVGGFVLPGDRVDVLLTRSIGGGENTTTVTQALADNVRVLGVDQSDDADTDKPVVAKVVTVEVTPDQAEAILLGQSVGTVSLMLRHVADNGQLVRQSTSVADLGMGPREPTRGTARATGGKVRVIRGVESTTFAYGAARGLGQVAKPAATPAAASGSNDQP